MPLRKFSPNEARDDHGRWTGAGGSPSFRQRPLGEAMRPLTERRSLIRTSLGSRASKTLIPRSYTGSIQPERPVDGWKALSIKPQVPKALPVEHHLATMAALKAIVQGNREGATEKAKVTRQQVAVHGYKDRYTLKRRTGPLILDPETPRGAVNRAYNHAAMLALHDAGVLDYDFKMSDAQKAELTPLIPFMRFTRRRLWNAMRAGSLKGASAPYKAAFGKPFPTPKYTRDGQERTRFRPNLEFVKLAPSLPLAKVTPGEIRAAARSVQVPTPGQVKAGNYQKGHVTIGGLHIVIETPKGRMRRGVGPGGKAWAVRMPAHYGYVRSLRLTSGQELGKGISGDTHGPGDRTPALFSQQSSADVSSVVADLEPTIVRGDTALSKHFAKARFSYTKAPSDFRAVGVRVQQSLGLFNVPAQDRPQSRIDALFDQAAANKATSDIHLPANASGTVAARVQGFGAFHIDRQSVVKRDVLPGRKRLKIGHSVIGSDAVSVVDVDRSRQRLSKRFFHDQSVLLHALPLALNHPIKVSKVGTLDAEASGHPVTLAPLITKEVRDLFRNSPMRPPGYCAALGARNFDNGHQVGLRKRHQSTIGADGDHVDIYLGPEAHDAEQHPVFAIDQVNARSGAFDEHKILAGFPNRAAALAAYDAAFSDGLGPKRRGAVVRMSFAEFKGWLRAGDTTRPLVVRA